MNRRTLVAVVAAAIFISAAFTADAQSSEAQIDWGVGPQNITGDLDVSTEGTLVDAYALSDNTAGNVTVNGVTFTGITVPNASGFGFGNYSLTADAGNLRARGDFSSQEAPYGLLSPEYQTLLTAGASLANPGAITLTLSGLAIGQQYTFQFWTSNSPLSTAARSGNRFNTNAVASNGVSLADNTTNTDGDLGQFAVGTFIATDTSEYITFSGSSSSNDTLINAFQLRALPVPEPSSAVLLALGLLSSAYLCRHQRRA